MAAKDNNVFSTALQFCQGVVGITTTPERILYGYAKLLLMGEASVKALFSEKELEDLRGARKWMESNTIDLELIKSGLSMLLLSINLPESKEQAYKEFEDFLEGASEQISSEEILKKVFAISFLAIKEIFAVGSSMDTVYEYHKKLKTAAENSSSTKETKETADTKQASDSGKEAEAKKPETKKEEVKKEEAKKEEQPATAEVVSGGQEEQPAVSSNHIFEELSRRYRKLSSALLDVVKGQDNAVAKFVRGCFQGELTAKAERGKIPQSYFFFLGPPGVGKTLLAQTAASALGLPCKVFNMSEYSSNMDSDTLVGTEAVYRNASEGELVKFVRQNPKCILVFDEIEKAHLTVIRLFLQILGSGCLYNVIRKEDTWFTDTIIIFTSNVGKELYADRTVNLTTMPERVVLDSIRKEKNPLTGDAVLPPEICSRIAAGNMIMFNHLSTRHLVELVELSFERVSAAMREGYNCHISYAKELPLLFLYNRGGEIDARIATKQGENFLKKEIYELTRQMENSSLKNTDISLIRFDFDWAGFNQELKYLFVNETKTEVLILAEEEYRDEISVDSDKYEIYYASTIEKARECLKQNVVAVFIDPFFGKREQKGSTLSIADYNTEGLSFFRELLEAQTGLPIYLLEVNQMFSEYDKGVFIREGAMDTLSFESEHVDSFAREFEQVLDELYMEQTSQAFSQQGWVVDYKAKQNVAADGRVDILFYDFQKRMAVDVESREALVSGAERPDVKFSDVIGAENAKDELKYFVDYLKNPKQFLMNGGRPPKGILLYGPPGTGKTMLAKAMAGETDVAFISTSATDLMASHVGESEANIRRIFTRARRYAPAIIFIDEIDAIGKKRTGADQNQWRESMLNALLTELDGFSTNNNRPVFVMAATNYGINANEDGIAPLDQALLRRFDNRIYVDLPNEAERKKYIQVMLEKRGNVIVTENAIRNVAQRTTGQSLAIIQNIIELAFRNASRAGGKLSGEDLLNALEEYIYGEKKTSSPEYYASVAIHEAGHAYISHISGDTPSYITIESRANFGGYMQPGNTENVTGYTREELLAKIRVALAGRVAEQVFFDKEKSLNTGASSDLRKATELAFHILCSYGMEDSLVTLSKAEILQSPLASQYVEKANAILKEEMEKTVSLVEEGRDMIRKTADALIAKNHLTGDEFVKLIQKVEAETKR